jgi:hypothetical protein
MFNIGDLVFEKLSNGKYFMIANRYGSVEKNFFNKNDLNKLSRIFKIEIR